MRSDEARARPNKHIDAECGDTRTNDDDDNHDDDEDDDDDDDNDTDNDNESDECRLKELPGIL